MTHCLVCRISQLDKIIGRLNHRDIRRMNNVGYRRPSIDLNGSVWFPQMKLQNDDNSFTSIASYLISGTNTVKIESWRKRKGFGNLARPVPPAARLCQPSGSLLLLLLQRQATIKFISDLKARGFLWNILVMYCLVIVPDHKVTTGVLNVVVVTVVEYVRMLLGTDGGCVPVGTPTLKLVEIRG
ncbi:hypothetical protein MTR_0362s0030 [Medicago truncatula]|uniref:Uncharacterized protein n=1 Tax=Medicago truncatula TaxID=3880 RepID=A0A072TFP6_MEDTR|nr:hypothetical protein MTR_0362s0030 [Medicago truncatula]